MRVTCSEFKNGDFVFAAGHFCKVIGESDGALMLQPNGEPYYILEDPHFAEHLCRCKAKRFRGPRSGVILANGWIHAVNGCSIIGHA